MQRFRVLGIALLFPAVVVMAVGLGCSGSGSGTKDGSAQDGGSKDGSPEDAGDDQGPKTPIEAKGVATLKGKVTYDGDPPMLPDYKSAMQAQKDKDHCLKGDTANQTWKVKDGALANVVVWIKAPGGKYFKLADDQTKLDGKFVEVDQPFCAFEPHVSILFPKYHDPTTKGQKATGQKLMVKNSAPMLHNTMIAGGFANPLKNETISSKDKREITLNVDRSPIKLNCNVHNWMNGFVWAFDHPYAGVSKGDQPKDEKDFGMYEIAKIPAGVPLEVWVWHEANPSFTADGMTVAGRANGVKLKDIKLKEGDNELNIKVKAK